jgi:hypothetical protein
MEGQAGQQQYTNAVRGQAHRLCRLDLDLTYEGAYLIQGQNAHCVADQEHACGLVVRCAPPAIWFSDSWLPRLDHRPRD